MLDEKTGVFLSTFGAQGQKFSTEIERITHRPCSRSSQKGVTFTKTMQQNSEEIAGLINEASAKAQRLDHPHGRRSRHDRARRDRASQKAASAAVTEMMETHGMLRNDTSALFERLREANVLLQEVLGGAHREPRHDRDDAVGPRRRVRHHDERHRRAQRRGTASGSRQQMKAFHAGTGEVLQRHQRRRPSSSTRRAKALAAAAEQIDASNRAPRRSIDDRREALDSVVNQIDSKVGDLDQRLKRFSACSHETFEAAEGRARDIARVLAESSTEGTKAIANQYELVRATSDEERKRTTRRCTSIYEQATGETSALFRQTSERFIEIVRQMREMSAAMQREMEHDAHRTAQGHPRAAAGDRRKRRADAPRHRRADRCAGRAQPHRRAPRPRLTRSSRARRAEPVAATPGVARPPGAAGAARRASRAAAASSGRHRREPIRRRAAASRRRAARPAPRAGRGGWLSDLLGRASARRAEPAARAATAARHAARWSRSTRSRSISRA